jgi:uncharacterized protein YbaP (TraB family)
MKYLPGDPGQPQMLNDITRTTQQISLWVLFLVVACSLLVPIVAAEPLLHGQGLLWKVEKPGQRPSYLFGTIHLDDPRVTHLPSPVKTAFEQADSFVMEALIDPESIISMGEAMMYTEGSSLQQAVGKETFQRAVSAMQKHGISDPEIVNRMKPWAVYMTISQPVSRTALPLDLLLYTMASQQHKVIDALESIEEQIKLFEQIPLDHQVTLLRDTLDLLPQMDGLYKKLIAAYLRRDLAYIMALQDKLISPSSRRIYAQFMEQLLDNRNRRMVIRMQPRLVEGNAFIAMGALHLPGTQGVLHLLENQGYRTTVLY